MFEQPRQSWCAARRRRFNRMHRPLLAVLLLFIPMRASARQDQGETVYRAVSPSVFLISTVDDQGKVAGTGSGFLVGPDRVLTNDHVARAGKMSVSISGFQLNCALERSDAHNDLAICSLPGVSSATPLALATSEPGSGATVFALGNPQGLERTISQGLFVGHRQIDGRDVVQITAAISPGSSGGPIVDSSGRLVGVAVGQFTKGQNLNFAVPLAAVKSFLQGKSATVATVADNLRLAEKLISEQDTRQYSREPESDYQRGEARIVGVFQEVIDASQDEADLKRVLELTDAFRAGIRTKAARKRISLVKTPTAEMYVDLAKAIHFSTFGPGPELKEAEDAARRAITLQPGLSAAIRVLGQLQSKATRHLDAYNTFLRLTRAPHEPDQDVYFELFDEAVALKRPTDADRWLTVAQETGEVPVWRLTFISNYLEEQKRFAEAAATNGEWARRVPGAFLPACEAGRLYWRADAPDSALAWSRLCIDRAAGNTKASAELEYAHRAIATILNERNVFDQAQNHARQALAIDAESAWAHYALAESLRGQRRWSEAVVSARTAIRLSDGRYSAMHFELGSSLFDQKQFEEAAAAFTKAAELMPTDSSAAYNVAASYYNLKNYSSALRWYREVLKRDPSHSEKAEIQRTIERLSKIG